MALNFADFRCTATEECPSNATMSVETSLLCDAHSARYLALVLRDLATEHTPGGARLLGQAADLLERWPAPSPSTTAT